MTVHGKDSGKGTAITIAGHHVHHDEYALLLTLNDVYWKEQGQLSVDVVLAFLAAGAAYLTGMTWIHESLRRARRWPKGHRR